nr:preprotein translocase subunit YajC [Desulfobulbaceae bacterium]
MFASIAHAAGAAPSQQGFMSFLPLVLIFAVFYFLLIRPQQKKAKEHQEFLKNIKKGDVVVSSGGIQGTVTGITDTVVTLEIADNVRVKVSRPYILGTAAAVKEEACSTKGG